MAVVDKCRDFMGRTGARWKGSLLVFVMIVGSLGLAMTKTESAEARQVDQNGSTTEEGDFIIGSDEIIASNEVSPPGKYPFMVGLLWADDLEHFCGGVLIDPYWVVTAAHCLTDTSGVQDVFESQVFVGAGAHNIVTGEGGELLVVADILIHEDYSNIFLGDDIALLELAEPAIDGAPIDLAVPSDAGMYAPGNVGTVMGWGDTDPVTSTSPLGEPCNNCTFPDVLHEADVSFFGDSECSEIFEFLSTVLPDAAYIADWPEAPAKQVCAGAGRNGPDTCQGDSGGPLIAPAGAGPWTLVGITSFGHFCSQTPGVYTEVAKYNNWIHRVAVPSASAAPTCLANARRITVDWAAPTGTNGGVNAYQVRYNRNGGAFTDWTFAGAALQKSFSGLAQGDYKFEVRARNFWGWGQDSKASTKCSVAPPGIPKAVRCFAIEGGIGFSSDGSSGQVDRYQVRLVGAGTVGAWLSARDQDPHHRALYAPEPPDPQPAPASSAALNPAAATARATPQGPRRDSA